MSKKRVSNCIVDFNLFLKFGHDKCGVKIYDKMEKATKEKSEIIGCVPCIDYGRDKMGFNLNLWQLMHAIDSIFLENHDCGFYELIIEPFERKRKFEEEIKNLKKDACS